MRAGVPARRSTLIGRDRDLGALRDLVLHDAGRLVTLTGVGGVGKTTLALELVRAVADTMTDGTWLIDLSTTPQNAHTEDVATQWLDSLGLVGDASSPLEVLVRHFRARRALLLVDNCEGVAPAVGGVVDLLLDACPYLQFVTTSRVRLKVRGEVVYTVAPLALPDATSAASDPDFEAVPAVTLFITRAREADPAFRVDGVHAAAVAAICHRLEGLPLAIELAAAHIHTLSPAEIEQRLAPARGSFASQTLATPERQVTLQATMAWSYELLQPRERRLFRGLSVFAGGWTLDAAEAVCEVDRCDDVQAGLQSLVEQSLVVREVAGQGSRFRFLEPVREYAALLLDGAGEREALAQSHAEYFLGLAARREPGASAPTADQMEAVAAEYPNYLAAIRFAEASGHASLALAFATELAFLWRVRGDLQEGLPHLASALRLAGPGPSRPRAVALLVLADVERVVGRCDDAMRHAVEGSTVADALGDPVAKRTALGIQGDVAAARGEYATARALYQAARRFVESDPHPFATGIWHANLGEILLREGRVAEASTHLEAALVALADTEETWYTGRVYCWLGAVERRRGHLRRAREHLTRGFEQLLRYGDRVDAVAAAEELACVALDETDPSTAAALLGAASALGDSMALPLSETKRAAFAANVDRARTALPPADFGAAWARGRALSFDQVVALARTPSAQRDAKRRTGGGRHAPAESQLTRREREVAELVAHGLTNPQIAERLYVSTGTVRGHVEHILGKLGLTSRVQVATWIAGGGEKPVI